MHDSWRGRAGFDTSQRTIVESGLPEAINSPSGLNTTAQTLPVWWPWAVDTLCGRPGSVTSQNVNAGSWLPVTRMPPPGWKAIAETSTLCPVRVAR